MRTEDRNTIIVIVIAVVIIIGGWAVISVSSGVKPPFTVVESHSMQHCSNTDHESEIGIIDTGDLILVKNPDKTDITSYVEGYQNGYEQFGDYGDVIVYKRPSGNPVIHRAFIWLNYNGDGTWTLTVDLTTNPDLVALLDEQHLLFTGSGYTPLKLYFK
jgi:signal peptidase